LDEDQADKIIQKCADRLICLLKRWGTTMNSTIKIHKIINLMTELEIFCAKNDQSIEISEFSETSIFVDLTDAKINPGQLVSISGVVLIKKSSHAFDAIANLVKVQTLVEKIVRLEFQLRQFPKILWDDFLISKESAQENIDTLLKKIKGEL